MDYPVKIRAKVVGHELNDKDAVCSTIQFMDLPDSYWRKIVVSENIELGTDLIVTISEDREETPF